MLRIRARPAANQTVAGEALLAEVQPSGCARSFDVQPLSCI